MRYRKELFVDNVQRLIRYGYEPEISIILKNGNEVFIVAYEHSVDLTDASKNLLRLNTIEDIFLHIEFDDIEQIEGDIDFEFPLSSQSVVVNGKLWINVISPKETVLKYRKQRLTFSAISVLCSIAVLAYFVITILTCKDFDIYVIIACAVFIGYVVITMILLTLLETKGIKLMKQYYGIVTEADQQKAKELLENISTIAENEYDLYSPPLLIEDINDLNIPMMLKQLIKGRKITIEQYEPVRVIQQELTDNKETKQYHDEVFNAYIHELKLLLENNVCDL